MKRDLPPHCGGPLNARESGAGRIEGRGIGHCGLWERASLATATS
jgi:hypothetical protein